MRTAILLLFSILALQAQTTFPSTSFSFEAIPAVHQVGAAQWKHAERTYSTTNDTFLVSYHYNTSSFSVPATWPTGEPHFYAKITVYRIGAGKKTQVAPVTSGQYVEKGCFEDAPEALVNAALKTERLLKLLQFL